MALGTHFHPTLLVKKLFCQSLALNKLKQYFFIKVIYKRNFTARCLFHYFDSAKNSYIDSSHLCPNIFSSNLLYFFYFCFRKCNLFLILFGKIESKLVLNSYTFFKRYIQTFLLKPISALFLFLIASIIN